MSWSWNWWLFIGATIFFSVALALMKRAGDSAYSASRGPRYRNAYQVGRHTLATETVVAGAVAAAAATTIGGFIIEL